MPRRYFDYTRLLEKHPEITFYQMISTLGGFLFVASLAFVAAYLIYSLFRGKPAPANPWGGATLEWQCASPPPHNNFDAPPEVNDPYDYDGLKYDEDARGYVNVQ